MKTYKEHQIITLSTKSRTNIILSGNLMLTPQIYNTWVDETGKCQHLYIISDEEIKMGDWVYSIRGIIGKLGSFENSYLNECKKIIASTDKSLSWIEHDDTVPYPKGEQYFLPQIPQQFIEQYIESYNKGDVIDKVMVEYQDNGEEDWIGDDYNGEPFWNSKYKLKLNPDNTINIKLKQKDIYSREEVEKLILSIVKDISYGDDFLLYHYNGDFKDAKQ